jgi:Holliday junction DNA helicase RuvA
VIARIEGVLAEKTPEGVVIDVQGVGYDVRMPLSSFIELPDEGKVLCLRVHTHVREEVLQLYGFLTEGERATFRLLLAINGVGPRLALAILSGLEPERLVGAVRSGDVAALRAIPGVGAKTAERITLELRDRVDALDLEATELPEDSIEESCVSALVNLGYPRAQAEKVVREAAERLPVAPALEDLVREALRVVAR